MTIDSFLPGSEKPHPDPNEEQTVKFPSTVLNESKAATVTAYIVDIKAGGAEICNCQTTDKPYYDTHIFLSKDDPTKRPKHEKGGPSPTQRDMVAEITPRMRQLLTPNSDEWTTKALKKALPVGTKVIVTGWLFYDSEHEKDAYVVKHADRDWRYSCLEIHPITSIEKAP